MGASSWSPRETLSGCTHFTDEKPEARAVQPRLDDQTCVLPAPAQHQTAQLAVRISPPGTTAPASAGAGPAAHTPLRNERHIPHRVRPSILINFRLRALQAIIRNKVYIGHLKLIVIFISKSMLIFEVAHSGRVRIIGAAGSVSGRRQQGHRGDAGQRRSPTCGRKTEASRIVNWSPSGHNQV